MPELTTFIIPREHVYAHDEVLSAKNVKAIWLIIKFATCVSTGKSKQIIYFLGEGKQKCENSRNIFDKIL